METLQEIKNYISSLPDSVDKQLMYRNMLTNGCKSCMTPSKLKNMPVSALEKIYAILQSIDE